MLFMVYFASLLVLKHLTQFLGDLDCSSEVILALVYFT